MDQMGNENLFKWNIVTRSFASQFRQRITALPMMMMMMVMWMMVHEVMMVVLIINETIEHSVR